MSYNLEGFNTGERIRDLRRIKNVSVQELSDYIHKSKSCISKYERNEVKPDFETILQICNCFKVSINEFLPPQPIEFLATNPFTTNILYIYYYTNNKLILSVIEIREEKEELKCMFYNGFRDIKDYKNACYCYNGTLESNHFGNTFFSFDSNQHQLLEKVLIIAKLPLLQQCNIAKCIVAGITPATEPVMKKAIISDKPLSNIDNFTKFFEFSSEELKDIKTKKHYVLKNKDYNEFYYDN